MDKEEPLMNEICGTDCCEQCEFKDVVCAGCAETGGHPCGGTCAVAECIAKRGFGAMYVEEMNITKEVNALGFEGLEIGEPNLLLGSYVNLEYTLPNGSRVKLLDDKRVYWADQVEIPGSERCYGVVADQNMLLVSTFNFDGSDPEILVYKKRG